MLSHQLQLEGHAPLGHLLLPTVLSLAASSQPLAARPRMPSSLTGVAPEDVQVTAMAQRVKEVLPHVPLEVIRIDLGKQCLGCWQGLSVTFHAKSL